MSTPTTSVEAEEVRIIDKAGRVCIRLGITSPDAETAGICLYRVDGSTALRIELAEGTLGAQTSEYPVITLYDEEGAERLNLNVNEYPGLCLIGSAGKPSVTLVVPPDEDYGEISLNDGEGHSGWMARGFDNDADRLNKLEYKVNHLFTELGITFKPLSSGVQALIAQGKKYEAIKL